MVMRACLKMAGIEFVDEIVTFDQFKEMKGEAGFSDQLPLGSMPVLTLDDGTIVVQSMAINRYIGKLTKMYPEDAKEQLFVDEILDSVADLMTSAPQHSDPDTKKKLREEFGVGKMKIFFNFFAKKLEAKGPYFGGENMTIADLAFYAAVKGVRDGSFDYIAVDYDAAWPSIVAFMNTVEANPSFAAVSPWAAK